MRKLRPLILLAALSLGAAHAFTWEPFAFPDGDQSYTLEIVQGQDSPATTIDIDVADVGDGYDVTTTMTYRQAGVPRSDLDSAMFGGNTFGMFAMGPMMMFGPTFTMVPMMLGEEDIHVREEPIRVMGFGSLHMDREVEVAGRTCVVMRMVPDGDAEASYEFAVAEGVPFPCYSRYGQGDDAVEIRLARIE